MNDLIIFLNTQGDFFIEVEGTIAAIRRKLGNHLNPNDEGVCALADDSNKWGLEFRLYTHERPNPLLGNKFHSNTDIRHRDYEYRLSDNNLVEGVLNSGYHLGRN
jgi:hypothetical protein